MCEANQRKDRFAAIRRGRSGLCVDHGQPFHNPGKVRVADKPDGAIENNPP